MNQRSVKRVFAFCEAELEGFVGHRNHVAQTTSVELSKVNSGSSNIRNNDGILTGARSHMRFTAGAAVLFLCGGCQDIRVTSLEQRVNHLEESVRKLEAERTKSADDDAARQKKLETCVAVANFDFQTNMANNGTKDGKGGYNVPVPVMAEMQRQNQSNLEECRLLYSH